MSDPFDVLTRANELRADRLPFVLATVTVSRKPTSARAGSRALITRDGALFGWVGGACSQPSVVRHALEALEAREPRVIRLSPDADARSRDGVIELQMTCHSGGTLEIFLEPFLPAPSLIIVGDSPVAAAVADLGGQFDFAVSAVSRADDVPKDSDRSYVVVATMGNDDEAALERALAMQPVYVGLVGSRRRYEAIADYLRARGLSADSIAAIRAPAGIDIRAQTPQEIALSIMAEIVSVRRTVAHGLHEVSAEEPQPNLVTDPVCGMLVDLTTARHTLVADGVTYGFCCLACKRRFEQEQVAS